MKVNIEIETVQKTQYLWHLKTTKGRYIATIYLSPIDSKYCATFDGSVLGRKDTLEEAEQLIHDELNEPRK